MQHSPTDPGEAPAAETLRWRSDTPAHLGTPGDSIHLEVPKPMPQAPRPHSSICRSPAANSATTPAPLTRITESGHAAPFGQFHGRRLPSLGVELPKSRIPESRITVTHRLKP